MRTSPFGPTGRDVPVVGFGTWNLETAERPRAVEAVRAALDAGMLHFDTAEMYGGGKVEELLAEAVGDRRDEIFLVSKVHPENASHEGTVRACERSLRRLNTDRLDCYLLHWESRHPIAETIAGFEELAAAGKILSFGVSNFDEHQLEQAVKVAGPGRIACNQVMYHLGERGIEHAVVPACERRNVAVVGYSPFAPGGFPSRETRQGRLLAEIAARYEATPRQLALAFLTRLPALFAIPMSSRPEHVRENAAAARLALSDDDLARIEAAFPRGPRRPGVTMG